MKVLELTREFQLFALFGKEQLRHLKSFIHPGAAILMGKSKQLKYRWKDRHGNRGVSDWRKGKTRNVFCHSPALGWFYFSEMLSDWVLLPDGDQDAIEQLWKKAVNEQTHPAKW